MEEIFSVKNLDVDISAKFHLNNVSILSEEEDISLLFAYPITYQFEFVTFKSSVKCIRFGKYSSAMFYKCIFNNNIILSSSNDEIHLLQIEQDRCNYRIDFHDLFSKELRYLNHDISNIDDTSLSNCTITEYLSIYGLKKIEWSKSKITSLLVSNNLASELIIDSSQVKTLSVDAGCSEINLLNTKVENICFGSYQVGLLNVANSSVGIGNRLHAGKLIISDSSMTTCDSSKTTLVKSNNSVISGVTLLGSYDFNSESSTKITESLQKSIHGQQSEIFKIAGDYIEVDSCLFMQFSCCCSASMLNFKNSTFFTFNLGRRDSVVDNIYIRNCIFEETPALEFLKLPHETILNGCKFNNPDMRSTSRFRTLKLLFSEIHDDRNEQLFSSLETRSHCLDLKWKSISFWEKLLGNIAWSFNRLGISLMQPLVCIGVLFTIGFCIYNCNVMATEYAYKNIGSWAYKVSQYTDLNKSIFYSFVTSLGPIRLLPSLGVITAKTVWVQIVAGVHGVICTILWYLFIMGIKKKFRQL